MKDEIKEFNEEKYVEMLEDGTLYDYITNLQEDNNELRKEVKELERMCELYGKSIYNAELTDYKSRNEKAIDKIIKIQENAIKYGADHDASICQDLLNILGGDDNE